MSANDLYSKRQNEQAPDVYSYNKLPKKLRVQISHILNDAIGYDKQDHDESESLYGEICKILRRKYGVFELNNCRTCKEEIHEFLLNTQDIEKVLSVIELCFQAIDSFIRSEINKPAFQTSHYRHVTINQQPDEAIEELNQRFKENGVGYYYQSGKIIRVDSQLLHKKVVLPTLVLLSDPNFAGANEEYMDAHEHFRHKRNKDCLVSCLKSFESTMKIICKEKGWTYENNFTAKKLIDVLFKNNLVPNYLQAKFTSLQALLESGVPTVRNKVGGHGQGPEISTADDAIAKYALNLTAANILFLIELLETK